jgi:RNA polymerase sigma-70 factor (ECF subfamily)
MVSCRYYMEDPAQLVARVAAGDFAAFEAVYDRFHSLVYAVALNLVADEAWAEDVTQDVFTKLWVNATAFRGGSFAGWIARVTRNRAIDLIRARSVRPEAPLPAFETLAGDSAPDEDVFTLVDGERVRAALRELPDDQRTLIVLGYFSDLTHVELAAHTGIPLGTVKTRIRSGLRNLRLALDEYVKA